MQDVVPYGIVIEIRHYKQLNLTHRHDHHQLILPIAGTLALEIEGEGGEVRALQGAVVPSNWSHSYQGIGENSFVVIDLPVAEQYGDTPAVRLWRLIEKQRFFTIDSSLYYYTQFLSTELSHSDRSSAFRNQLASLLLNLLLNRSQTTRQACSSRCLSPALAYLHENYHMEVTVGSLAALANLSLSRFYAIFQEHTGQSPGQYLTHLRVTKALQLLESSHMPLSEIALAVGYSSQAALNHAFKRYFGVSPGRYRQTKSASLTM